MTIQEAYYRVKDMCNKLVSNSQQVIPPHIFVQTFNETQLHWAENCYKLDEKNKSEVHKLQQLIVPDKKLKPDAEELFYTVFNMPENYFKYSSSITVIESCPYYIENHLKESHNKASLLKNPDWTPSIKFEETVVIISDNKFLVFKNDELQPKELLLTYYRMPVVVDMADGFDNFEGSKTKNINPEWTGSNLEEILDATAKRIMSKTGDLIGNQGISQHINETQIRI